MKILNANNYKFVAQDQDGSIYGFTERPKDNHPDFWNNWHGVSKHIMTGEKNSKWKDTLIETKYFDAYLDEHGHLIGVKKEKKGVKESHLTYQLIISSYHDHLVFQVNQEIREGWLPQGGVSCNSQGLIQAMIKSS